MQLPIPTTQTRKWEPIPHSAPLVLLGILNLALKRHHDTYIVHIRVTALHVGCAVRCIVPELAEKSQPPVRSEPGTAAVQHCHLS